MTRYELLDRIGVGGMAEIFRGKAVAAGGFEKPVAIKRILPHLSQDKRFVELLIAEAKVLSLLKHRNIVQIFDVGLGDDGKYFLVMEFVDGKDLRALQQGLEARRKRMPLDLALHVGAEICEALEHAHTARAPDGKPMSLVHRDVSPSNVLVSRAGEVKLTDFGIAKRAEQETQAGAVRGKFAYISPEQARNQQIEPRSDVFSVGILLWEMITSRRLFSGLGDLEALRAVREAVVPRPSEADPRISPDVERLVMSALSRDPKQRPSAGNLGAKLRSLRYSLEVTVGDPSSELAKIIDTADQVQRESQQMAVAQLPRMTGGFPEFDHTEATVIRIRTADAFSIPDKQAGMAKAREVIDRFEEEETRFAQLSGDQLKVLRSRRDSAELAPPPRLPGVPRGRRPTDEPTTAHNPLTPEEINSSLPANSHFDSDESTRLVVPSRDRRTPVPERVPPPPTQPPPNPGTVHHRNPAPGRSRGPTPGPPAGSPPFDPGGGRQLPLGAPPTPPTGSPPGFPPPQGFGPPQAMGGPPPGFPPPQPQGFPPPQAMGGPPPGFLPPQPQGFPPPQHGQPMQHQHGQPMFPSPMQGGQPSGGQPGWGVAPQQPPRPASPTAQDMYERPVYPQHSPAPPVAGFNQPRKQLLQPWMLVVGALIMAALAFAITRVLLS